MKLSDITIRERMALPEFVPCMECTSRRKLYETVKDHTPLPELLNCAACSNTGQQRHYRYLGITPFAEPTKVPGKVSFGLSSYGYDLRLGDRFLLCPDQPNELRITSDHYTLQPHSFILGESLEHFVIPEDVIAQVNGKSTLARKGIFLPMTPLEPGWRGIVTMEIANLSDQPVVLRAGEGIGQVMFDLGDRPCQFPYNRKPGASYQDQTGVTKAK